MLGSHGSVSLGLTKGKHGWRVSTFSNDNRKQASLQ